MGRKLSYCDFLELIRSRVSLHMNRQARLSKTVKNNGVVLDTLDFLSEGRGLSPVIYMQEMYQRYRCGGSLEEIVSQICQILDREKENGHRFDPDWFLSWNNVRDHIFMKLVNQDRNRAELARRPHRSCLDLAICYYLQLPGQQDTMLHSEISSSLAEVWKKDEEMLYQAALENTGRDWEEMMRPLDEILGSLLGEEGCRADALPEARDSPIYMLSNREGFFGAVYLFVSSRIREFAAGLQSDIHILPSSVHELLLVPQASPLSGRELQEIVSCVNRETVSEEEFLSDHVYRYLLAEDRIVIEE